LRTYQHTSRHTLQYWDYQIKVARWKLNYT
jgi:hypothetical protein